ncbi:PREDICTED: NACHT, LRR and PYD domains-containing protein 10 [Myotis davidii]|uniref:NACHT, LRR and PYD domains-containing protein 10 n=1 Tax=Myotis davidii TaxID=225400 RepID=L5LYE9_MYODS|nr:PREDICTED: NACHT, LRR and PYD domains-containing protein 10 [Myotis davidii]XP_015419223.1 PREDICTED: NACHT, LRR and PYD domains-containing protein 10 [Myotis davidii]XP_015419224.1 PREDICTED: NACHT, LRR and PYD domains-containing protein 10 [Myotis davidii]ELK30478.1 NACHT, LRR and PYD domains-containing protein 10 [Myotis davidii]
MALALTSNPQEALLLALSELDENDFKILKFHLRDRTLLGAQGLARGELEGLSRVDLASRLVLRYGAQEAVKMVCKVLQVMNLLELVDQLSHICLNDYRETYREYIRCLEERQEEGVSRTYNQLLLVAIASSGSPEPEQEQGSVTVEALFDPGEMPTPGPATVVLQGPAGTGKTTLARKMVLDWATGTLYKDRFDYVFYVSCREVVLLPEGTLDQLLLWCCGDSKAPVTEIRRQPERLLFILDGYDELQRPFAKRLKRPGPSPAQDTLRRLIRREVLPTCSLLITTRPLALRNLQSLLRQPRHVHVQGFSEESREKYVQSYFTDGEQAQKAFDFIRGNDVLYQACLVPGICWVVCSWLKGRMERGGEVSETPSSGTDIFMAYVSTFLPPSDNEDPSELTRDRVLRGLCSLAAEGIQHQRFLFEEADLRKHSLDGPSLAAFLSSQDYQEGLDIKKFYSFRHISFQEFFHAMSYLVKEDQSQLGEESLREVNRLLGDREQAAGEEMTLSMQFLLDISKKESSSNLELTFCFKISPSIKQDLKNFKEQMSSLKHNRSWEWDFFLNEAKMKSLANCVQMSNVAIRMEHSNEKNSHSRSSLSVKTTLSDATKEEQKCLVVNEGNVAGTQKQAASGKSRGKRN